MGFGSEVRACGDLGSLSRLETQHRQWSQGGNVYGPVKLAFWDLGAGVYKQGEKVKKPLEPR